MQQDIIDIRVRVKFKATTSIVGEVLDWFGNDVQFSNETQEGYDVTVKVNENAMFHWAMQYGPYIEVLEPPSLRQKIKEAVAIMNEKYKK